MNACWLNQRATSGRWQRSMYTVKFILTLLSARVEDLGSLTFCTTIPCSFPSSSKPDFLILSAALFRVAVSPNTIAKNEGLHCTID